MKGDSESVSTLRWHLVSRSQFDYRSNLSKKLSQNTLIGEVKFLLPGEKAQVEGNVFDRGVDAVERYFLQNRFPLTRAHKWAPVSQRRGSFGIVTK